LAVKARRPYHTIRRERTLATVKRRVRELVVRGPGGIHRASPGGLTGGIALHPAEKNRPSGGCVFQKFLTTTG
jgi:hypothetical protein